MNMVSLELMRLRRVLTVIGILGRVAMRRAMGGCGSCRVFAVGKCRFDYWGT